MSLTGTGTSSVLTPKSATLDLGTVKVGRSAAKSHDHQHRTAPLSITGTTTTSPAYTVALGSCAVPVAAGRTCSVTITLDAQAASRSCPTTVGFVSDATNQATIRVTATVQ